MSTLLRLLPRLDDQTAIQVAADGKVVMFTSYQRMGVIVMAVAGVLSCVFVSLLLLYIFAVAMINWSKPRTATDTVFTSTQIAIFLICLLVSDLIQSASGIAQIKWARENKIYDGRQCVIQAATLVVGDLGSTIWSCVIAIQTFSAIALGKHWPRWVVWFVVVAGWLFVIILTFIAPLAIQSPEKGPYYSIAGTWCFISSEYAVPRLVIHYVPLFVASILIIVLYGLIFLVLRGTIGVTKLLQPATGAPINDSLNKQRISIAKRMLWYPVGYFICIIPIAITRLVGFKDNDIPEPIWIFGMFFLFFLGTVDTVIYATTRKVVRPIKLHRVSFSDNNRSNNYSQNSRAVIDLKIVGSKRQDDLWVQKTSVDKDDVTLQSSNNLDPTTSSTGSGIQVTFERIQEVM